MATFKDGANGSFSGKVGSVIGYQWRGINVMRSLPKKSNKPRSEKQLANEMRMKLVMSFLKPITGFIRVGYQRATEGLPMTPFNMAVSYHKKNAISGSYPDLYFDYSKAQVSTGPVPPAESLAAERTEEGIIFSWDTSSSDALVQEQNTMIIVHLPETQGWDIRTSGITRGSGQYLFTLPPNLIGKEIHAYVAFNRMLTDEMSDSRYIHIPAVG